METTERGEVASQRIVEALARADDVDPLDMTTPLYDVIDPDALNAILETGERVEVQFEYAGHTVVADSTGRVTVDGAVLDRGDP